MAFDYKKEYKEFYLPPKNPGIVDIPEMRFVAVRGQGNPNEEGGAYQQAMSQLYGISWTLKMSYKGPYKIDGFFEYAVPPLEGFWWQEGVKGVDYARKDTFRWISAIRLPDFVGQEDFDWAVEEATRKKKQDFSQAEFLSYAEGLCVQCMHIGPYDAEPVTIRAMDDYAQEQGYILDITDARHHHEIYLGDPRKGDPAAMKTVLRYPIRKA